MLNRGNFTVQLLMRENNGWCRSTKRGNTYLKYRRCLQCIHSRICMSSCEINPSIELSFYYHLTSGKKTMHVVVLEPTRHHHCLKTVANVHKLPRTSYFFSLTAPDIDSSSSAELTIRCSDLTDLSHPRGSMDKFHFLTLLNVKCPFERLIRWRLRHF